MLLAKYRDSNFHLVCYGIVCICEDMTAVSSRHYEREIG